MPNIRLRQRLNPPTQQCHNAHWMSEEVWFSLVIILINTFYCCFSCTDGTLSIKMLTLLLLLTPDHKTKASSDLLVTFIPVSIYTLPNHKLGPKYIPLVFYVFEMAPKKVATSQKYIYGKPHSWAYFIAWCYKGWCRYDCEQSMIIVVKWCKRQSCLSSDVGLVFMSLLFSSNMRRI